MRITMHTKFAVVVMVLFLAVPAFAQMHRGGASGGQSPERFERFRTMRLIEVLKLSEDSAARFVAKETAHQDAIRKLVEQRNSTLDDLRKALKDNESKNLDKPMDQVLSFDEQIYKERQRYQAELRGFLTPEQFAKYLVFERELGRGVRDAIQDMARDRGPGRDRHDR